MSEFQSDVTIYCVTATLAGLESSFVFNVFC